MLKKIKYWNRILKAYAFGRISQLTFWHNEPKINLDIKKDSIGPYYMQFREKANFNSTLDSRGIPMLDYQGSIGLQYNPISISQWGLGNYNLWFETKSKEHFEKFMLSANWLVDNLEKNKFGFKVWMHYFDFEYRDTLKSPWYSGLAQGQGISLLVRAFKETNKTIYKNAAYDALEVFKVSVDSGGVNYCDSDGNNWIEEYIVSPPTHILNGFMWGLWGVYDFSVFFDDENIRTRFNDYTNTLKKNIDSYDTGYWSLYEHSGTRLPMIASLFYHKLHIVQLQVMFKLTSKSIFIEKAKIWEIYLNKKYNRKKAFLLKAIFKVIHY